MECWILYPLIKLGCMTSCNLELLSIKSLISMTILSP